MTRRGRSFLVALGLLVATVSPTTVMAADERCDFGRGITVWENSLSGASATWCANSLGRINIPDLSQKSDNLAWPNTWWDRISSYQTFNMPSNQVTCLFENASYTWSVATRNSKRTGNATVQDVGSAANDRASSIKSQTSSFSCPTS